MTLKIKFKVMGKRWKLFLLTKKQYRKKIDEHSIAECHGDKHRIYLSPFGMDIKTLRHELVHAHLYELCLESASGLTKDAMEEIFAELMAHRGPELLRLANRLLSQVKELTEPKK